MSLEMGKTVAEAKGEVTYGAEFFRWFAEEAVRIHGRWMHNPAGGSPAADGEEAGRSVPVHHALELPARDGHPQDRSRGRGRLHDGRQAGRDDTADDAPAGRDAGGGRAASRASSTSSPRAAPGRSARRLMADDRLRKLSFTGSTYGRQAAGQAVRRRAAAGQHGARRQRAVPGLRGRRPRRRGRRRDDREDAQHGRGLHGGQPVPGPRVGRRRRSPTGWVPGWASSPSGAARTTVSTSGR